MIRRRSHKNVSEAALNALCRRLVVELRDHNLCQRCGKPSPLEWSHVIGRSAKSVQWADWNSLALCGPKINDKTCHGRWHTNVEESMAWWRAKFPERALQLDAWRRVPQWRRPKVDRVLIRLALIEQIRAYGVEV